MLTKDNLYMQKLKVTMILIQKNKNPTNFGLPKKKKKPIMNYEDLFKK